MAYFIENKNIYKKKKGGGPPNVLNKQTCFNHELARRESDRDQNPMLVITKSFGFVSHRRYIGYWIEKSRARMPGGGV